MRSLGFTLFLALLATFACGVAGWQWIGNNFDAILGVPPTPVGAHLYTGFSPDRVKFIRVSQNDVGASFSLTSKGWQATAPWQDRMDPRAAVTIIDFTLGMRVEDLSQIRKIDPQKAGLRESGIDISLEDERHQQLARYRIGRRTPWLAEIKDIAQPVPTVFISTRDRKRKNYVYACTGDISPLFKDGLKFLRDYHPFYFNPLNLQKIRIRTDQGELTLARESPKSPWHVIKPLDLPTDPKAIKTLIEGLYELQAVKVSDRSSVTIPTISTTSQSTQIAISSFGSEVETVLDIYPPDTPNAADAKAVVSNRPGTVFDLPIKPEANLKSLADLPLSVNDLRDSTLTNLHVQSLRGISIEPATGAEIIISRTPPQPWMATIDGQTQEANEARLYTLLKAVTDGRVIGFESDAATDFTPWGLDKPFLRLRFLGENNQVLELAFGMDRKGDYFVNRTGTPTVMRVDASLIQSIAVRPYEWRNARLWSVDKSNLMAIEITHASKPPLLLVYDDRDESWTASQESKDLTAEINPSRATYILNNIEGLKVSRWLSPTDEAAADALTRPEFTISIMEKTTDNLGDVTGTSKRTLHFAPNTSGPNPSFYFGRLDSDPNPFLLDKDTFKKISTDVMDKQ